MPSHIHKKPKDRSDTEAIKGRVQEIVALARDAGLTQDDIAEKVDTGQTQVSTWERGTHLIGTLFLMRLIRVCSRPGAEVDANYVLLGTGEMFRQPLQETPDEAYVRSGLTILARLEQAVGEIRGGLLAADARLTGRGVDTVRVAEEVDHQKQPPSPPKRKRRRRA